MGDAPCICTVHPCVHDRLPHLRKSIVLTVAEKRGIKEILDTFAPRPIAADAAAAADVSSFREIEGPK